MSEWRVRRIRDLLAAEWPGEWGSDPADFSTTTIVYRSTDMDDDGHLDEEQGGTPRTISIQKLDAKRLVPGDILLEASGGAPDRPVARVAQFRGVQDAPAVCANFLRTLRPKSSEDSTFIRWALVYLHAQPEIWRYQQQTTGIINLKTEDYLDHRIPVIGGTVWAAFGAQAPFLFGVAIVIITLVLAQFMRIPPRSDIEREPAQIG